MATNLAPPTLRSGSPGMLWPRGRVLAFGLFLAVLLCAPRSPAEEPPSEAEMAEARAAVEKAATKLEEKRGTVTRRSRELDGQIDKRDGSRAAYPRKLAELSREFEARAREVETTQSALRNTVEQYRSSRETIETLGECLGATSTGLGHFRRAMRRITRGAMAPLALVDGTKSLRIAGEALPAIGGLFFPPAERGIEDRGPSRNPGNPRFVLVLQPKNAVLQGVVRAMNNFDFAVVRLEALFKSPKDCLRNWGWEGVEAWNALLALLWSDQGRMEKEIEWCEARIRLHRLEEQRRAAAEAEASRPREAAEGLSGSLEDFLGGRDRSGDFAEGRGIPSRAKVPIPPEHEGDARVAGWRERAVAVEREVAAADAEEDPAFQAFRAQAGALTRHFSGYMLRWNSARTSFYGAHNAGNDALKEETRRRMARLEAEMGALAGALDLCLELQQLPQKIRRLRERLEEIEAQIEEETALAREEHEGLRAAILAEMEASRKAVYADEEKPPPEEKQPETSKLGRPRPPLTPENYDEYRNHLLEAYRTVGSDDYRGPPDLLFERDRLQRELEEAERQFAELLAKIRAWRADLAGGEAPEAGPEEPAEEAPAEEVSLARMRELLARLNELVPRAEEVRNRLRAVMEEARGEDGAVDISALITGDEALETIRQDRTGLVAEFDEESAKVSAAVGE